MARHRIGDSERAWTERIGKQAESGVTVARFCRRVGCSEASFYYWKRKLGRTGMPKAASSSVNSNFLAVTLADQAVDSCAIEIELPNRALVRIPSRAGKELLRTSIEAAGRLALGREEASC